MEESQILLFRDAIHDDVNEVLKRSNGKKNHFQFPPNGMKPSPAKTDGPISNSHVVSNPVGGGNNGNHHQNGNDKAEGGGMNPVQPPQKETEARGAEPQGMKVPQTTSNDQEEEEEKKNGE